MTPLSGKRIVVTRPRAQAADLCDRLAALGAIPILIPTIEIEPIADNRELDQAIFSLSSFEWIIFTSVNGACLFWERIEVLKRDSLISNPLISSLQFAAIGPATALALTQRGATVTVVPPSYVAESLVESLGNVRGQHILIPRAQLARDALKVGLEQRGALVHEIATYQTRLADLDPQALNELRQGVDALTFTSSSTVRNFLTLVGQGDTLRGPHKPAIVCIGPITAQTARECGLSVSAIASEYTTHGLIEALQLYFSQSEQSHVNFDPQRLSSDHQSTAT